MFTRSKHTALSAIALLTAILAGAVALPVLEETSTVFDPVGDALFNAPAFQDFVLGRLTKTENGDFHLLMEMAGPVPVAPTLPPPGANEIWWSWSFDFDPTASPQGWPFPAAGPGSPQELIAYVSWDGTEFAGTLIDRRPLLTGGEAIITPVPFSIDGAFIEAFLPYELIGDAPPSFRWGAGTRDWSGPVGSYGTNKVDGAETIFNP